MSARICTSDFLRSEALESTFLVFGLCVLLRTFPSSSVLYLNAMSLSNNTNAIEVVSRNKNLCLQIQGPW